MELCGFKVGLDQPFFLIAGPCVIESEQLALDTAGYLKELTTALNIPFIYKSPHSFFLCYIFFFLLVNGDYDRAGCDQHN